MSDHTPPPLPDHPEPYVMQWTADELTAIHQYGGECAEAARAPLLAELRDLRMIHEVVRGANGAKADLIDELHAKNTELERGIDSALARIAELERLCDATYVAQGADAYNHAVEIMEAWRLERKGEGKPTCPASLCDGLAWMFERIAELEAAVLLARNTFEGYAALHREKGTADGNAKAALNAELATRMQKAMKESGDA